MDKLHAAGTGLALLVLAFPFSVFAQEQPRPQPRQETQPATLDVVKNLKFRNLGPANAGGRVAAVVGVPGDPNT